MTMALEVLLGGEVSGTKPRPSHLEGYRMAQSVFIFHTCYKDTTVIIYWSLSIHQGWVLPGSHSTN